MSGTRIGTCSPPPFSPGCIKAYTPSPSPTPTRNQEQNQSKTRPPLLSLLNTRAGAGALSYYTTAPPSPIQQLKIKKESRKNNHLLKKVYFFKKKY
jgi:hypothetical protein